MQNKTSVFAGQSGTGKSSLINAMTEHNLRTGEIINRIRKGAHTTTTASLLPLQDGGYCIDTPGIRSFGVWDLDEQEVEHYFPDIATLGSHCHFSSCPHQHEPHCAVLQALEEGSLLHFRYQSYVYLMQHATERKDP